MSILGRLEAERWLGSEQLPPGTDGMTPKELETYWETWHHETDLEASLIVAAVGREAYLRHLDRQIQERADVIFAHIGTTRDAPDLAEVCNRKLCELLEAPIETPLCELLRKAGEVCSRRSLSLSPLDFLFRATNGEPMAFLTFGCPMAIDVPRKGVLEAQELHFEEVELRPLVGRDGS